MAVKSHTVGLLYRTLKPLLWPGVMLLLAATLCACGGSDVAAAVLSDSAVTETTAAVIPVWRIGVPDCRR